MLGNLEVIIGEKGSGLTSTLREKYSPLQETNKIPFIIFVHKKTFDEANEKTKKIYTDSNAQVVSSAAEMYSHINFYKIEKNKDGRVSKVSQYQQIFIDGIHNFGDLSVIALLDSAAYHGKKVVAAGNLTPKDSGFPYPIMPALIAKADNVTVLSKNENLEIITGCMFSSKSQKLARKLNDLKSKNYNVLAFKHALDVERFKEKETFIRGQSNDPYGFEAYPVSKVEEIEEFIRNYNKKKIDCIGIDEINFFQEKELLRADMPEEIYNLVCCQKSQKNQNFNYLSPYEIIERDGKKEVYFKKPKIQSLIEKLVKEGVKVIVSGLDTDYRGEPWEWFTLFCMESTINKSTAQCSEEGCLNPATRTMRLTYDSNSKNYKKSEYNEERVQVGTNIEFQQHIYTSKCREHHGIEYPGDSYIFNPKIVYPF